jgi:hypothetical protein
MRAVGLFFLEYGHEDQSMAAACNKPASYLLQVEGFGAVEEDGDKVERAL